MSNPRGIPAGVQTEAAMWQSVFRRLASLERASSSGGGGDGNAPVVEGWWSYDNATTGPAGTGEIRTSFPDGNPGTSGTVWLSTTDDDGLDWSLLTPQVGQTLVIRDEDGDSWTMSVDAIPSPGEFTTTILTSTGTAPNKNTRVKVGLIGDLSGGGAAGGFTYFGSATPTATEIGETWFDTNTGHANVWDGFLWVPYAIYPGGDTVDGIITFQRSSDVTLVDGTGALQVGPDGGSNVGFDGNEIVARDGSGGRGVLWLNETLRLTEGTGSSSRLAVLDVGGDANYGDGSGYLQIGASGGPNVGFDNNEIISRNGSGVRSALYFHADPLRVSPLLQINGADQNNCFDLLGASGDRPYMSIYGGTNSNRAMYIGYPNTSNDDVFVYADKGALHLEAVNNTDGVRSDTIYNATANDWGVFIEANGRLGRTASSERFKTNIEDLGADEAAEILADFDWVRFNYKDEDGEAKPDVSYGGIAEWLHEKRPEFVGYDDESLPSMIRYNAVWPIVARVTQAQQETITEMQETIDELSSTVADLARRLEALGG